MRSFSALAGTLTVPVVFLIGARLAGRAAGLVAAMLVAVHPLMVWYGQEARAYALLVLLCAVTLLAVVHLLEGDGGRWWAVWAVSAALAVATHYFGLLLVGPELRAPAARPPRRPVALGRRGARARHGGGAGAARAGAAAGRATRTTSATAAWSRAPPSWPSSSWSATRARSRTSRRWSPAVLAAFAVVRVVAVADRPHARVTLLVAAIGLGSVLATFVLALAGLDYLNTRNLLPVLLVVAVVLGVGYVVPPERAAGLVAAALLGALLLVVTILVATNPRFQRDDWRGVSAALGRPAAGRAIVVSPGSGPLPLGLYQDGLRPDAGARRRRVRGRRRRDPAADRLGWRGRGAAARADAAVPAAGVVPGGGAADPHVHDRPLRRAEPGGPDAVRAGRRGAVAGRRGRAPPASPLSRGRGR